MDTELCLNTLPEAPVPDRDGTGELHHRSGRPVHPGDFTLAKALPWPLRIQVRVRLESDGPVPVRVSIFRHWGRADQTRQVFLHPNTGLA